MSLQSDHKALIFLATVAVLGAGVRVVRASGRGSVQEVQPALDRQVQAADSASRAGRGGRGGGRAGRGSAQAKRTKSNTAAGDTTRRKAARDSAGKQPRGALDRPGWIGGKLDLDVASAAQLDSLPGVTPAMAKRIVADRMTRGPFLNRDGLRRVPGTGPRFLAAIDSTVTFSGTFSRPVATDTVIPKAKSSRSRKASPPPP
jgi:DNA uptake protein ComE-like DNA-binding protein